MLQDQSEAMSNRIITPRTSNPACSNSATTDMFCSPPITPEGATSTLTGAAMACDWMAGPLGAAAGASCAKTGAAKSRNAMGTARAKTRLKDMKKDLVRAGGFRRSI